MGKQAGSAEEEERKRGDAHRADWSRHSRDVAAIGQANACCISVVVVPCDETDLGSETGRPLDKCPQSGRERFAQVGSFMGCPTATPAAPRRSWGSQKRRPRGQKQANRARHPRKPSANGDITYPWQLLGVPKCDACYIVVIMELSTEKSLGTETGKPPETSPGREPGHELPYGGSSVVCPSATPATPV